ncbi:MAG TPA: hypothetical protein VGF50_06635, partial [Caulobacteraceae bacterium]
ALAVALVSGAVHAQTSPQRPPPPVVIAPAPPVVAAPTPTKLASQSVYIYSFLDVREDEFSHQVLDQIDKQLQGALAAADVKTQVLRFLDSQAATGFAQVDATPTYGRTHTSDMIPVGQTIASNLPAERAFGARFRLLVFPSKMSVAGDWRFYQIRWYLVDCATNRTVWTFTYAGKNFIWLYNGERAESRAKPIVDALVDHLRTGGWL